MTTYRADPDLLRSLAGDLDRRTDGLVDLQAAHAIAHRREASTTAQSVAAIRDSLDGWLSSWSHSLRSRADLLDRREFYRPTSRPTLHSASERDLVARDVEGVYHGLSPLASAAVAAGDGATRKAFLMRRSEGELSRLAQVIPDVIGDEAYLPLPFRFSANRRRIELERAAVLAELEHLRTLGSQAARSRAKRGLKADLKVLDSLLADGRNFLYFDPRLRHVVEYHGRMDAKRVMVVIPGVDTDLAAMAGRIGRWGRLAMKYDVLDGERAVITTLLYDPPSLPGAYSTGPGLAAAERMGEFLATALPGDRKFELVGHSYGSFVAAQTLFHLDRSRIDHLYILGSPGTGVDHVSELPIDQDKVTAILVNGDEIRYAVNLVQEGRTWWQCATPLLNPIRDPAIPSLPSCDLTLDRLHHGTEPTHPSFGAGRAFKLDLAAKHGPLRHNSYFAEYTDDQGETQPEQVLMAIIDPNFRGPNTRSTTRPGGAQARARKTAENERDDQPR